MKAQYLTEKQVSEITGRAVQTLRNERFLGRGIPYVKVGRSIRYSLEDVVWFMVVWEGKSARASLSRLSKVWAFAYAFRDY